VIRIDAVWMAVEPLDMRVGTETALARVIKVFGEARVHHAYLFANRRANRTWATAGSSATMSLSAEQLRALVIGLPWHRIGEGATIRVA
jgi:hypothetical protein